MGEAGVVTDLGELFPEGSRALEGPDREVALPTSLLKFKVVPNSRGTCGRKNLCKVWSSAGRLSRWSNYLFIWKKRIFLSKEIPLETFGIDSWQAFLCLCGQRRRRCGKERWELSRGSQAVSAESWGQTWLPCPLFLSSSSWKVLQPPGRGQLLGGEVNMILPSFQVFDFNLPAENMFREKGTRISNKMI